MTPYSTALQESQAASFPCSLTPFREKEFGELDSNPALEQAQTERKFRACLNPTRERRISSDLKTSSLSSAALQPYFGLITQAEISDRR